MFIHHTKIPRKKAVIENTVRFAMEYLSEGYSIQYVLYSGGNTGIYITGGGGGLQKYVAMMGLSLS